MAAAERFEGDAHAPHAIALQGSGPTVQTAAPHLSESILHICVLALAPATVLVVCAVIAAVVVALIWLAGRYAMTQAMRGGSLAEWNRVRQGLGLGMPELARRLGRTEQELATFTPVYFARAIKKRSGGTRTLHVPDPRTKTLQRAILRRLLARLRVHPAVHGFEPGRSIVTNAREHVGQKLIVKVDIKDFFPSTRQQEVVRYFQWIGWDRACAELLARLCCHEGGLPQGAPTSPRLSNLVNGRLDGLLQKYASRCRAKYTRYADDITFSTSWKRATVRAGLLARGMVRGICSRIESCGYQPNTTKIRYLRAHQQQRVTGLVVNQTVNLPRKKRRTLRAIEHRFQLRAEGIEDAPAPTLTESQLAGWRGILRMVEKQRARADNAGDGPVKT